MRGGVGLYICVSYAHNGLVWTTPIYGLLQFLGFNNFTRFTSTWDAILRSSGANNKKFKISKDTKNWNWINLQKIKISILDMEINFYEIHK